MRRRPTPRPSRRQRRPSRRARARSRPSSVGRRSGVRSRPVSCSWLHLQRAQLAARSESVEREVAGHLGVGSVEVHLRFGRPAEPAVAPADLDVPADEHVRRRVVRAAAHHRVPRRPSAGRPARGSTSNARSSKCCRQSHGVAMRNRSEALRRRAEHEVRRAADAQQPPQHRLRVGADRRSPPRAPTRVRDAAPPSPRSASSPSPGHALPRSNECASARRCSVSSSVTSSGSASVDAARTVVVERGVFGGRDLVEPVAAGCVARARP